MKRTRGVIRKWKRVVAVGCSHGDLADKSRLDEVMKFVSRFDPKIRFELGDVMDTAAFRHGAKGTKDEATPIDPDNIAAVDWIRRYRPTHLCWGNHDWRLVEWRGHHNATLAYAAGIVWNKLEDAAKEVGAKTIPYDIRKGWFFMGGYGWTHGYMYSENAVRDHAEMAGVPLVMAHLHRPIQERGRTLEERPSFCVGTLGNLDKFQYARRRRAFTRWGAGIVFGEMCENDSRLWIASAKQGEELRFPFAP